MEGGGADDSGLGLTQHQPMYVELHCTPNERFTFDALLTPKGSVKQEHIPTYNYGQTSSPATNFFSEPEVEESACAGLMVSSALHGGEGSLVSHTSSELPAMAWNGQRQFFSLNWQARELGKLNGIPSHTQIRVAHPPADVRARNQVLPRYRPRITDQELQYLTGKDSNSIVTPLFEKVLSASDAGKCGRLVLPKACAEGYFPPISEPEGVPLIVQDVVGREWTLQFRFWPNSNSRMYVLEGVTPCIQSMNLQAGDTVIFSRIDPEGKLVISFRRAPRRITTEGFDGLGTVPATSQRLTSPNTNSNTTSTNENGFKGYMLERIGPQSKEEMPNVDVILVNDKRKGNKETSTKNKRQQQDTEREFRKNWEDAQNLLRPPPNVAPTIVTIEGYEFEEYEEPPVLGTPFVSTDFSMRRSHKGAKEEKASVLSEQAIGKEIIAEPLKQMIMEPSRISQAHCWFPTLATNQGSNNDEPTTTKHPRHRVGCSCIVCIQPPSGKGPKHKPDCDCTVCSTVKRRFQTLMLRRKKEKEVETGAAAAQRNQLVATIGEVGTNGVDRREDREGVAFSSVGTLGQRVVVRDHLTSPRNYLDLKSQPTMEEDIKRDALLQGSTKRLTENGVCGLYEYLRERGLTSLPSHNKQAPVCSSMGPHCIAMNAERWEHDSSHSVQVLSSHSTDIVPTFDQTAGRVQLSEMAEMLDST